jgi:phosphatidate phosphatase APP1
MSLLKGSLVALFAIAPRPALSNGPTRAVIVVYDGFADPRGFFISGRVLRQDGTGAPDQQASEADNLVRTVKALESDEVPSLDVDVEIHGVHYRATTDDDGVFRVEVNGLSATASLPTGTHAVTVRLAPPRFGQAGQPARFEAVAATGSIVVVDDADQLAVISDIDDTVVKTHVTSKVELMKTVLLKNGAQLDPVQGAAANYRRAQAAGVKVFFYLSGSPQNFYTRLHTFLEAQRFPRGPLLLKNIGDDSLTKQHGYKSARLEALFARFPRLRFILVGDSGEHDPEIYRGIRDQYPDRVVATVIRQAPGADNRAERFAGMTTFDDRYPTDDVLARLVATPQSSPRHAAPAPPTPEVP